MSSRLLALASIVALAGAGCNRGVDVDDVPLGKEVAVTREDGGVVQGTLAARDEKLVAVSTGAVTRSVPRNQIADVRPVEAGAPLELPPAAKFREYTVPSGTELSLTMDSEVTTASSRVNEDVRATLARAVHVDDVEVLPSGAVVVGRIAEIQPAGKVKGRARVTIEFNRVETSGDGYPINARFSATAPSTKSEDAKTIGIPAVGGAVVGGIFGGKKGAALGAAIGGGAGTAAVLMTPGEEITLPRGTSMTVTLASPVDVRLPIAARR